MKENTNSAIAFNTIVLYSRLIITAICGFFTTRFALQALGVVDFGLFSVVGSIITFIAIINTIMVSTSHRFISVAIGKRDIVDANAQFNVCLVIHIIIASLTLIIGLPVGKWYINNYINYAGDINNALMVCRISIIASAISFVGVPYNGLLTAKERFIDFCIPDVIAYIAKLVFTYFLISHFTDKLFWYALVQGVLTALPIVFFIFSCNIRFYNICHLTLVKDKTKYKSVVVFSAWVAYGAFASVGKSQGAAIIVNRFFDTIMNTALGVANSINSIILNFANNAANSIAPQITKSYAAGDYERSMKLLILSTKMSFFIMLFVSSPFFVDCNWILSIWLKEVPDYAVIFTTLIIIDSLVESLNSGIKNIIFASGKIRLFQIIPSTVKLISIVAAYFVLKQGVPAYFFLTTYIACTFINVILNQWILHYKLNFNNKLLFLKSYIPSVSVVVLFLPIIYFKAVYPMLHILIALVYLAVLFLFIGLNRTERQQLLSFITNLNKK